SLRQRGLRRQAARKKTAELTSRNPQAKLSERVPAARARLRVRGLAASSRRSTMRLKVMAALRAPTMATTIQPSTPHGGQPPAASMAPSSAKGRAKTECSNLIISSVRRVLDQNILCQYSGAQGHFRAPERGARR